MIFLSFWGGVGEAIIEALRSLMLSFCEFIYRFVVFFFNIFITIGNARILRDSQVEEIYERIGLILGLFMIFTVTFSLIQYVMNPDLMVDKQKGLFNIVKKIVIVVVLLGVTPSIFNFAYDVQRMVIDSNIIPKVITGKNNDSSDFGEDLAWYAFSSFFKYSDAAIELNTISECPELNAQPNLIENDFRKNNTLRYAYNCVNKSLKYSSSSDEKYYVINFEGHGIVAFIAGLIILWMIIMYVIQTGIRLVQLAYLQLIAPIPIISYLTPKGENTFNKWIKQCITTYLDFFIRVALIYFVVFIIQVLIGTDNEYFIDSLGNFGENNLTFITFVMIIALLIFAKKVPDLIKELFPSSGGAAKFDFGLSPKKVLNDTMAAGLIGGTVGALGAGASNAVHGFMNMKKEFNKNGGWKNGKAWGAAAGAGLKGVASIAGGVLGGARAGLKTKDITKAGEAIKTANTNRENRELKAEAGYHWYNPLPSVRDKILEFAGEPGAADTIKNRQQAMRDERKRQSDLDMGENLYNNYSKIKDDGSRSLDPNKAFKNDKYRESYDNLSKAKSAAKAADLALSDAQAELNAARISGDTARIAKAKDNYEIAYGNNKAMQGKLELAKAQHDSNMKIYADDAKIEKLYKYYADTHAEAKPLNTSNNEADSSDVSSQSDEIHSNSSQSSSDTVDNGPIDLSSGNLSEIRESLKQKLHEQEEEILRAQEIDAETTGKHPFSPESQKAHQTAMEAEQKRDEIEAQIQEIDDKLNTKPAMYSSEDLTKAINELARLKRLQKLGKVTDVEVYQQELFVRRIQDYLNNN